MPVEWFLAMVRLLITGLWLIALNQYEGTMVTYQRAKLHTLRYVIEDEVASL